MRQTYTHLSVIGAFIVLTSFAVRADDMLPKPWKPKTDTFNVPYSGTVVDITKTSITIQWTASPNEPPKTFVLSETLAAGKIPMQPRLLAGETRGYHVSPTHMYRITDVKIGDAVVVAYAHIGTVDTCDHICIQRRPNGTVPPLPEEAENLLKSTGLLRLKSKFAPGETTPMEVKKYMDATPLNYIPYHEKMNNYWEREHEDIPSEEKFKKKPALAPRPREAVLPGPALAP